MSLKRKLKEKFDYDVSALEDWKSNTLPDLIPDLVETSTFLSSLTLEEGIKGTRDIALLNADITLQAKQGCTASPDGSVIFTGVPLTTHLLYAGIEFCNEDLNGKMTEVLNALGVKNQNGQLPAELEDILTAYLMKKIQRKAQRLLILGDTTSLDPELALFDGLRKIINNNADVEVYDSPEIAITAANAYDIAVGVYDAVPAEVFDNEMSVHLYMGRDTAKKVVKAWNASNPYNLIDIADGKGTYSFKLPLTEIEIMVLPELTGTDEMYAIPLPLTFLGTDELTDMELEIKYDNYNDKLKAEASFRLGTAIVWAKYFVRLELAGS